ncbi:hypothetical protein KAR48_01130 [bacterium]|nr:hypothetical protein [bacterium]
MDTVGVNINYRPLRIAWAIHSEDFDSFRKIVRYSHVLWGGLYSPVLFVDCPDQAQQIIELFRVDFILPIGDFDGVQEFPKNYPHLMKPFHEPFIFNKSKGPFEFYSRVLDIRNTLDFLRNDVDWRSSVPEKFQIFDWNEDDPLADLFLMMLGALPAEEEVGYNYLHTLEQTSKFEHYSIDNTSSIPLACIEKPSLSKLVNWGLRLKPYAHERYWNQSGIFIGKVDSLDDLVCFWNLRACNIRILFVDVNYIERFEDILPVWEQDIRESQINEIFDDNRLLVRFCSLEEKEIPIAFRSEEYVSKLLHSVSWNGLNVHAPGVFLKSSSALGVVSSSEGRPQVDFSLANKPFSEAPKFHFQLLVASVPLISRYYDEAEHSFVVPYYPELNEYFARNVHFEYDKLRVEPDSVGIIIRATQSEAFLRSLNVLELTQKIFNSIGYQVNLSYAGLMAKQLLSRLGGLQGGRVFKIPGVRRLFKESSIDESIKKKVALIKIGEKDPSRPEVSFADHSFLFIEKRSRSEDLSPASVFGYLVEKGLFRIGVEFKCKACKLPSWLPLDSIQSEVVCPLCGTINNITRSLADSDKWQYRRSGVFGIEKNAQGAVPVLLTLQQLDTTLFASSSKSIYLTSFELFKNSEKKPYCEVDFIWISPQQFGLRTDIIIAECKDAGPFEKADIDSLLEIAKAFPRSRFDVYILLSKIAPFKTDELSLARNINFDGRHRAILLTSDQLEPYFINEKVQEGVERRLDWSTPNAMAQSTYYLYFEHLD